MYVCMVVTSRVDLAKGVILHKGVISKGVPLYFILPLPTLHPTQLG